MLKFHIFLYFECVNKRYGTRVKNWYQILKHVKNGYQMLTHLKNCNQIITYFKNWNLIFTDFKSVCKFVLETASYEE